MTQIVPWMPPYIRSGSGGRRRAREPRGGIAISPPPALRRLDITVRASSFMSDVRSAYDGSPGGTEMSSFVAVPGLGAVPNRVFWFSQSDGTAQRGQNPINWFPSLAGYVDVQVPLGPGMVDNVTVAAALFAAASAFGDYIVSVVANVVTIQGNIDSFSAFTGPSYASRGDAGLWGIRAAQVNTLPFGVGQAPITACLASHAISPANPVNRIKAMDVFIGAPHNAGDQLRIALYEGGSALSPVGATLLYDFGQITGVATNQWVRLWVALNDTVTVGSATNMWMLVKSSSGLTSLFFVFVGTGWNGDCTDQDLWTTTIAPAEGVPFPASVPAGGGPSGANVIVCMRVIYDSSPYVGNGSWRRRFGVHIASIAGMGVQISINDQVYMGQTPPQALDMELDYLDVPYGTLHVGQFRGGFWNGGLLFDPTGTPILSDLGQTSGAVTEDYVRISAPGPGAGAISVDPTLPVWWGIKNNAANATFRLALNPNPEIASPPENPMDWELAAGGPGTGSEWAIAAGTPGTNTDPAVPWEAAVPAGGAQPGDYPFAPLGFRINPITLVAS